MSIRTDVTSLKKRVGLAKRPLVYALAHGYNGDGEILFDVLMTPFSQEKDLTEAELHAKYPDEDFDLVLRAWDVVDANGDQMLDDEGRPELVDFRGI